MYVYTPPQGHHTPPHPMGGVGTRDTGPYMCIIYIYVYYIYMCILYILYIYIYVYYIYVYIYCIYIYIYIYQNNDLSV